MFVKNNIKKILYTLFFISLYKFGSYILLPGINENMIIDKSLGWWEKLYALNISNLVNFNIISVGITTYLSAQTLIQIFASKNFGIPFFQRIKEDKNYGELKLNEYTQYLLILISFVQSLYICTSAYLSQNNGVSGFLFKGQGFFFVFCFFILNCTILITGSLFSIWIANQISKYGIENGTSLIIFTNLISNSYMGHWDFIKNIINNRGADNMILLSIILCTFLLIIVFEKGVKVIDVYFPSADGCAKKELKLKINNSGVFSIILASSVMHFPEMIKNYLKYNQISFEPLNNFFNLFSKQSNWYYFIYGTLVFIFTYNQSEINLNAEDINNQLQDHNLLIDKRQGEESIEYLDDTIFYLKIISACYVTLICILPDYLLNYLGYNMEFSGTSILVLSNICQLIFHGTLDHNYKEQIGKFIPSFLKK